MQLLKPAGKFADELQGVVQPWPLPGRFKSIRCEGNWQKWHIKETKDGLGYGYGGSEWGAGHREPSLVEDP